MSSYIARELPARPTEFRILNRILVVTEVCSICIQYLTVVVVHLVTHRKVGIDAERQAFPANLGIQTTLKERRSLAYYMRIGSIVVIGSGLVAAGIQYIVAIRIHYIPQRVTIIRVYARPFFQVPGIDVLTFFHLLRYARSVLQERFVIRRIGYAVAVETDIKTDIPAPVSCSDSLRIEAVFNTLVTYRTCILGYLKESG